METSSLDITDNLWQLLVTNSKIEEESSPLTCGYRHILLSVNAIVVILFVYVLENSQLIHHKKDVIVRIIHAGCCA